jgi:hypothetical protein
MRTLNGREEGLGPSARRAQDFFMRDFMKERTVYIIKEKFLKIFPIRILIMFSG